MDIYKIIEPIGKKFPFILSIPHSGIKIPNYLLNNFNPEQLQLKDDTDWFLDQLYDFAPKLGITTIIASISRWVVDLNRNPKNKPLYNDGRILTSVCPKKNFLGQPIYKEGHVINSSEVSTRIKNYFNPYHQKINELIKKFKVDNSSVFIWDAHSIKRNVPTINETSFPDLIIGNNDNKSCEEKITKLILNNLKKSKFEVQINQPFKGGFITRSKGLPNKNIHAVQLEMSKDLYMSYDERKYDIQKAEIIKTVLEDTFIKILNQLK